uniref:Uncharacterized protein n=1 Tax=Anguilla anguilla TaxID=7936 RepID=A0A0E9UPF4_ANGAN
MIVTQYLHCAGVTSFAHTLCLSLSNH